MNKHIYRYVIYHNIKSLSRLNRFAVVVGVVVEIVSISMTQQAHFGSFKSPISSDLIVSSTIRLGAVRINSSGVYWNEGRPLEGGRNVLSFYNGLQSRDITQTPELNVRSVVHEYGGGEFQIVECGDVYFTNFNDKRVYKITTNGDLIAVSTESECRYADFAVTKGTNPKLVCVCEDHSNDGEPINTLVALNTLDGSDIQILVDGEDFYASPRISDAGDKLAWLTWTHPNMPWDGTELWVADLIESELGILSLDNIALVAGGSRESIFQPQWSPDGVLYFISDRTGWWNLYRQTTDGDIEAICAMEAEFGLPQWIFGQSTYGFLGDGKILCSYKTDNWHMAILDPADITSGLTEIETPYSTIYGLVCHGNTAAFIGSSATEFTSVILLDLTSKDFQKLRASSELEVDSGYISAAQHIEFPTDNDLTAHGWYYAPKNCDFAPLEGELPPLLVKSHGGPTSSTPSALNLSIQYWTSRGFAVLDVDYGGSTGYGREYRERLRGNWGVVDVNDCVNGAKYLVAQALADPNRLAITGGSAGGYTTLAALTFTDIFKAGASHYGICDLEALATDTHKFESRYLDSMIGKYPEEKEVYIQRSPIHFTDRLTCGVAFFQGLEDKVVLPNQAEMMAAALRAKGLPVAHVAFEGEQHGFRKAENIKKALDGEFYFYSRVFGFATADDESRIAIPIENLS